MTTDSPNPSAAARSPGLSTLVGMLELIIRGPLPGLPAGSGRWLPSYQERTLGTPRRSRFTRTAEVRDLLHRLDGLERRMARLQGPQIILDELPHNRRGDAFVIEAQDVADRWTPSCRSSAS